MTIEELNNTIRLYDGSPPLSDPLSATEKELYHLAIHMKAILEAWATKPVFATRQLFNTLDHAAQPLYEEREQR